MLRALSWDRCTATRLARFIRDGSGGTFRILDGALYTSLHGWRSAGWSSRIGNVRKGEASKVLTT